MLPPNRTINIRSASISGTHKQIIYSIYVVLEKNLASLVDYLNFVYDSWYDCKSADVWVLPNWLGSPRMMQRFKESAAMHTRDQVRNTFSDHTGTEEAEDGNFDTSTLWAP